jgi:hypothetical protein
VATRKLPMRYSAASAEPGAMGVTYLRFRVSPKGQLAIAAAQA